MNTIRVIDARMGRGKTTAAIRYINETKGKKRFLFVTPFLTEVDRICKACDFDQPKDDANAKSIELRKYLRAGENVAISHALFHLMERDTLELVKRKHYSLIVDESLSVITKYPISNDDFSILMNQCADVDENDMVIWRDPKYKGVFKEYKKMSEEKKLYVVGNTLFSVMSPELLTSFDEVIMMTYMFGGQYQKAYLDFFWLPYTVCGIEEDSEGYKFSDKPDDPGPINYDELIHIVENRRMNAIGDGTFTLAKAWYEAREYDDPEMKKLRNNMYNFFKKVTDSNSGNRLWTCFKGLGKKLIPKNGRFSNNFLQLSARATNNYRDCTALAYMINRYMDPNYCKFFAKRGVNISRDQFALSEMLQWIWRSAIRDDKPITIYIPSERMRSLLKDWMRQQRYGGDVDAA